MQPRGPLSLQTHGRATRRPCRAPASPCCPWRPTLWTKCGATRDPLYLPATSTASQRSSQVRLPPISARSEEGHALSPPTSPQGAAGRRRWLGSGSRWRSTRGVPQLCCSQGWKRRPVSRAPRLWHCPRGIRVGTALMSHPWQGSSTSAETTSPTTPSSIPTPS